MAKKMDKGRLLLGAHMSTSGGAWKAIEHGVNTGCTAIQIFTKNNNQWKAKSLSDEDAEKFLTAQKAAGIAPVVSHTGYLINCAAPNDEIYQKSIAGLVDEIERADKLQLPDVVLHPGSPLDQGQEYGMQKIIDTLNYAIDKTPSVRTRVALELTAGQGSHLGYQFEQVAQMIAGVENQERISVCLDTCHIFAAGYDIRTKETYEATINQFKKTIGLKYLKVIHLNDSIKGLGSRVDRHIHIGEGAIGKEAFRLIIQDERFVDIPKLLETPKGTDAYTDDLRNLAILKGFWEERKPG
jgi:deoxyribonuclease-4